MMVIDGAEIWSPEDEAFLQDHMDERDQAKRDKDAAIQFAKRIWQHSHENVEILVEHAFAGLRWEILYELPDSPDFFLCECANGYTQAFHSGELRTTRNN